MKGRKSDKVPSIGETVVESAITEGLEYLVSNSQNTQAVFADPIRQISFVVTDIDKALQDWLAVGVGPWFVRRGLRVVGSTYRGAASEPTISMAFANSGDLQIELIATEDDTPSLYWEFLESGRQGFHHFAYWTDDVPAAHERALSHGWVCIQSGPMPFHYFEVSKEHELIVEVSLLDARMTGISEAIRAAAVNWNGVDQPIREYPPLPAL